MTNPAPQAPDRDELWRQHQLALSVLNQRGDTAEAAAIVRRVLEGEAIQALSGSWGASGGVA